MNKLNTALIFILATLVIFLLLALNNREDEIKVESEITDEININEHEMYYMYSNINGHYFLIPSLKSNNVVYLGLDDHLILGDLYINTDNLYSGKRYMGTLENEALIKLVELDEGK